MAAITNINAANAHSAIPGTMPARWASFTSETSTPSMNTSTMPHGRTVCIVRNTIAKYGGARPSLRGTSR